MTAQAILEELERNGLKVAARDANLLVVPRGVRGPDVRALLNEHETAILRPPLEAGRAPHRNSVLPNG
jgi:hypothetical protein